MCPIQYQSLLVLLDPPDGIFQSKVEKQCTVTYFSISIPDIKEITENIIKRMTCNGLKIILVSHFLGDQHM
jgi:hypothetical protein